LPRNAAKLERWGIALSLVLLVALLAINLYIYSPWHHHSRITSQLCAFFQFEHGSLHYSTGQLLIPPPLIAIPCAPPPRIHAQPFVPGTSIRGRAPPAGA